MYELYRRWMGNIVDFPGLTTFDHENECQTRLFRMIEGKSGEFISILSFKMMYEAIQDYRFTAVDIILDLLSSIATHFPFLAKRQVNSVCKALDM